MNLPLACQLIKEDLMVQPPKNICFYDGCFITKYIFFLLNAVKPGGIAVMRVLTNSTVEEHITIAEGCFIKRLGHSLLGKELLEPFLIESAVEYPSQQIGVFIRNDLVRCLEEIIADYSKEFGHTYFIPLKFKIFCKPVDEALAKGVDVADQH